MKSRDELDAELRALLEAHYYSEGPELQWAVRAYEEQLGRGERDLLRRVVLERLVEDPSPLHVVLCSCWRMPEAVPVLTSVLDDLTAASPFSRLLMGVLAEYSDEAACRSVERFLDSEQEGEALMSLARMNFARALPGLKRALRKDHMLDVCLHVLHNRRKEVGLASLRLELARHVSADSDYFRQRLRAALAARSNDFNPFTPDDAEQLLAHLPPPDEEA